MGKTNCLYKIKRNLDTPLEKNGMYRTYINLPCGKCERCIERRKMEWGFRMEQELKVCKTAYFITLTYNNKNVPYNETMYDKETKQEVIKKRYYKKTLNRYDLEKFIKRLRQNHKRTGDTKESVWNNLKKEDKIKFYAAGEYGEDRFRPHYHLIIYNTSEQAILKSWKLGSIDIQKASSRTIGYLMKYLDKRIGAEKDYTKAKEFNTMSEGIGKNYITKNKDWHRRNIDVLFVTNSNGVRIPMPKYYRNQIFTKEERMDQVEIVEEALLELKKDLIKKVGIKEYNRDKNLEGKISKMRFDKKIKKRIID